MKRFLIIFSTLLLSVSCIEEVDFEAPESENIIVVEGFITDTHGPHVIRLSRSAQYGSTFDAVIQRLDNATVALRNSIGENLPLIPLGGGQYATPSSFIGIQGETYTLLITTNIGQQYSSLPVTLPIGPDLIDVDFRFRKSPSNDPLKEITGVEVFAKWADAEGEQNFYMWEADGIYQITTNPELYRDPQSRALAPKSCCSDCFVYEEESSGGLFIQSDANKDGRELTELAAFILDDGKRFNSNYQLRLRQYSLTKEAFAYFNLLSSQLGIDGDIFDAPPAQLRGNIISLDDPTQATIGYFGAFHVSELITAIPKSIIEDPKPRVRVNDDCRVLRNASVQPPNPWN